MLETEVFDVSCGCVAVSLFQLNSTTYSTVHRHNKLNHQQSSERDY